MKLRAGECPSGIVERYFKGIEPPKYTIQRQPLESVGETMLFFLSRTEEGRGLGGEEERWGEGIRSHLLGKKRQWQMSLVVSKPALTWGFKQCSWVGSGSGESTRSIINNKGRDSDGVHFAPSHPVKQVK